MNCINTNKQRMVIWFSQKEPQNVYDLWLHDTGNHDYVLSVYQDSQWWNILGGSGGGSSCHCPEWIPENKPSWWDKAASFDWNITMPDMSNYVLSDRLNPVSLKVNGQSQGIVYSPHDNDINISISTTPGQQITSNALTWSGGSNNGISLGTLKSTVNGLDSNPVNIKIPVDTQIVDTETDNTLPTSLAVKTYVDGIKDNLQTQINDKQQKITGGTVGQILSKTSNGLGWIDDKWFVYQNVQYTNPTFKRNSLNRAGNVVNIEDAHLYDCGTVTSVTLQNITNPQECFLAGSIIKLTADTSATLTIGSNYNVINPYNLSESSNVYTLSQGKIYYIYIKMDNVIIYEVGTEAVPVEPDDPNNFIDFDFVYWYGGSNYNWNSIKQDIDNKLRNNPQIDDSDFPIFSKCVANNITITDSNIDAYKLYYDNANGSFLFVLLKSTSNVKVLIKDATGINDYMDNMIARSESYTYVNDGSQIHYDLYLINLFSNNKIVIQNT